MNQQAIIQFINRATVALQALSGGEIGFILIAHPLHGEAGTVALSSCCPSCAIDALEFCRANLESDVGVDIA